MSSGEPVYVPPQRLLTLRIINLALVTGCAAFAVIVVMMRQPAPPPDLPLLSYLGAALAVLMGLAYNVVPDMVLAGWRRRLAAESPAPGQAQPAASGNVDDRYWDMLNTHFIVGAALLEGTIFFLLIAFLQEGLGWTLAVAGLFGLALALKFPTEAGMRQWAERQRELVEQARAGGAP